MIGVLHNWEQTSIQRTSRLEASGRCYRQETTRIGKVEKMKNSLTHIPVRGIRALLTLALTMLFLAPRILLSLSFAMGAAFHEMVVWSCEFVGRVYG